jgi:TonB family protein
VLAGLVPAVLALLAGCAATSATAPDKPACSSGAQLWTNLANGGNAAAAYLLGMNYEAVSYSVDTADSSQRETHLHSAFLWYSRAAELGHVAAINKVGTMYFVGSGVPRNEERAAAYYQRAAERGNVMGESNLGALYMNGDGVPRDLGKGLYWLRKAAEAGNAGSQCNLGVVLSRGGTLNTDYPAAVEWYRKSAEQGYAEAQNNLGYAYMGGRGVTRDIDAAFRWYQKAADQGYAPGQYNLGVMYRYGQGTPKDIDRALSLFLKAADQGYADAQRGVAELYLGNELGAPKDELALRWYVEAAKRGDPKAQLALGTRYAEGMGVGKNPRTAVIWLSRALAKGNYEARQPLYSQLGQLRELQAMAGIDLHAQPDAQSDVVRTLAKGEVAFDLGGRGDWIRLYTTGDQAIGFASTNDLKELRPAAGPQAEPDKQDIAFTTEKQPWQKRFPQATAPAAAAAGAETSGEYGSYAEQIGALVASRAALPAQARAGSEQGTVTLIVRIQDEGDVGGVTVSKGSGYCLLDQEAVSAVLRIGRFPSPPSRLAEGLRSTGVSVPLEFSAENGVRLLPYPRAAAGRN